MSRSVGDKRLSKIEIRVSQSEKEALRGIAEAEGITLSELARRRSLVPGLAAAPRPAATPAPSPAPQPHPHVRTAPTIQAYKLDALGPDPLRGGMRSVRR